MQKNFINPFKIFTKKQAVAADELVGAYGILMPAQTRRDLSYITTAASIGILFAVITGFPNASPILTAFYKNELQMSNGLLSVLLAIPQVAVIVQIPISLLLRKTPHLRAIALVSGLLVRLAFILMAVLAYLGSQGLLEISRGRAIAIAIVTLSSLGVWTSDICVNSWLGLTIPYECRGRYLSTRQLLFTLSSLVFSVILVFITAPLAQLTWKYSFYFVLAGIFGIADIAIFAKVSNPLALPEIAATQAMARVKTGFKEVIQPLRDKQYRSLLGFVSVWYFAVAIPQPFFNVHMDSYLQLPLGLQTVLTTAVTGLGTVMFVRRMGRSADYYGYRNTLLLTAGVAVFLPLIWTFITPNWIGLILVANFLSGVFFVSTDMNVLSMSIFLAPADKRPSYLVARTLFQALLGTVPGMLIGGQLMEKLAAPLEARALPFLNGQVLMPFHVTLIVSFVLRLLALLLFGRKLERQEDEPAFKVFLGEIWRGLKNGLSGFNHRLNVAAWFRPRHQDYITVEGRSRPARWLRRFPPSRWILYLLLRRRKQKIVKLQNKEKRGEEG